MRTEWRSHYWLSSLTMVVPIVGFAMFDLNSSVSAQIIPDATLGAESSVVTPDNIKGIDSDRISGGAVRGSNLFHSFQEFNIGEGRGGYFENPAVIQNIFSRVTGSNPSEILGTLGVLGNANLFFINPNGIIFGQNASLDLRGSFLATTADSIVFPDGNKFSAVNPDVPPLLTINRQQPIGLEFEGREGKIFTQANLEVNTGQNLALVGGDVSLDGANLIVPGGRVELGGLSAAGEISINADGSLSFPPGIERADVLLTNDAFVNVRAEGEGSIRVNAKNLELREASQLLAGIEEGVVSEVDSINSNAGDIEINTTGVTILDNGSFIDNAVLPGAVGNSGDVKITTNSLFVTNGSQLSSSTLGEGNAGSVIIYATDAVSFDGTTEDGQFSSAAFNFVIGTSESQSGGIKITTGSLSLTNRSQLQASTIGKGDAGNITIETGTMSVINSQVGSIVFGEGNAGNLTVRAAESVEVSGKIKFGNIENPAGLFAQVNVTGEGRGGNLTVETKRLSVSNGGKVQVATFGQGDAGNLLIRASEVEVFDTPLDNLFPTGIFAGVAVDPDETVTPPEGEGGNLTIETERLSVRNGAEVSVSTAGLGNAGALRIQASESVEVVGTSPNGDFKSKITAAVTPDGIGRGGNLRIETGEMIVRDGAEITVSSLGLGVAGDLEIEARSIEMDNQGLITATTRSGNGGDITLKIKDLMLLKRNSRISTNAGTSEAGGDGGDINIDAPFIIAIPEENNDITANAFEGKGGNIIINTNGILGIEFRNQQTDLSDITVSSRFGQQGEVEINTSAIDPTRGLNNLQQEVVEAEVAQGCQTVEGQPTLEFFDIGRGGLPPTPDDLLSNEMIIPEWIPLDFETEIELIPDLTKDKTTNLTLLHNFSCQK